MMIYKREECLKLWKQFSEIEVNDNNEILKPFIHFSEGTDCFDIFNWFESTYKGFKTEQYLDF